MNDEARVEKLTELGAVLTEGTALPPSAGPQLVTRKRARRGAQAAQDQPGGGLASLPSLASLPPLRLDQLLPEAVELHSLLNDLDDAANPAPQQLVFDPGVGEMVRVERDAADQQAEYKTVAALLDQYMTAIARKVDGIAGYRRFVIAMHERAAAEQERVYAWKKRWEERKDGLDRYVIAAIQKAGISPPRVESATNRLRVQGNSQAAVVFDLHGPSSVFDEYVDFTVRMPWALYQEFKTLAANLGMEDAYAVRDSEISRSRLSADLAAGVKVEGARLEKGVHLRAE